MKQITVVVLFLTAAVILIAACGLIAGAAGLLLSPTTTPTPTPIATPTPTAVVIDIEEGKELPPSHEGGYVGNSGRVWLTPTPGPTPDYSKAGKNISSGGYKDVGVEKSIPPNAVPVTGLFSWYWPPLGPPNCARSGWTGSKCLSKMTSGKRWQNFVGRAVACPPRYRFGTKIYAFGREWICLDRGGAIVSTPNGDYFDFLLANGSTLMAFKSQFTVWVVYP